MKFQERYEQLSKLTFIDCLLIAVFALVLFDVLADIVILYSAFK